VEPEPGPTERSNPSSNASDSIEPCCRQLPKRSRFDLNRLYSVCCIRPHTRQSDPTLPWAAKIPTRLKGLHAGLQLHAAFPSERRRSHRDTR
jgi:hypothetical protein